MSLPAGARLDNQDKLMISGLLDQNEMSSMRSENRKQLNAIKQGVKCRGEASLEYKLQVSYTAYIFGGDGT